MKKALVVNERRVPELLLYVRSPDELKVALAMGADTVIVDSVRTRPATSSSFDLHSIEWAHNYARNCGKRLSVWFGRTPGESEIRDIRSVLKSLKRIGIGSIIAGDPFVLSECFAAQFKETILDPSVPVCNRAAAAFWSGEGLSRWFAGCKLSAVDTVRLLEGPFAERLLVSVAAGIAPDGSAALGSTTDGERWYFLAHAQVSLLADAGMRGAVVWPSGGGIVETAVLARGWKRLLAAASRKVAVKSAARRFLVDVRQVISTPISHGWLPGYLHSPSRRNVPDARLLALPVAGTVKEYFSDQGRAKVTLSSEVSTGNDLLVLAPGGNVRFKVSAAGIMDSRGSAMERANPEKTPVISLFVPVAVEPYSIILRL